MLPYLTAELPGIGGRLKEQCEDFVVEEIPAYEPSGTGEHLYLWVEKRDMGTDFFLKQLAHRLGIRRDDIGLAGMKDRRAVTRQWVSVPLAAENQLGWVADEELRVLQVSRHGNKLRPGHLRGNRFQVRLRGVEAERGTELLQLIARLTTLGFPNYYGEQRFGHDEENLTLGLKLLKGEQPPLRNRFLQKLALSAVQSDLFNRYVARRLLDGMLHRVLVGDIMAMWPQGGHFTVEQAELGQPRLDRREIVPTGPMFGRKMIQPRGEAAAREETCLAEADLRRELFAVQGKLLEGTRRPLLCFVDEITAEWQADSVLLSFALPSGCYATVLLAEIMKV